MRLPVALKIAAVTHALRQRLAPAGLLGSHLEDTLVARLLAQQRAAELEGILARRVRQLVDEALAEEAVLRVADRAPEPHLHAGLLSRVLDAQVGDVVRH